MTASSLLKDLVIPSIQTIVTRMRPDICTQQISKYLVVSLVSVIMIVWSFRTVALISQPTIRHCKVSKVKGLTGIYDPPSIGDILNQRARANFRVVYSCPASENNITLKQNCAGNNKDRLRDYL